MLSSKIYSGSNPYVAGSPAMQMWEWLDEQLEIASFVTFLMEAEESLDPEREIGDVRSHLHNIAKGHAAEKDSEARQKAAHSIAHLHTHPQLRGSLYSYARKSVDQDEATTKKLGRKKKGDDAGKQGVGFGQAVHERALDVLGSMHAGGGLAKHAQELLKKHPEGEIGPKHFGSYMKGSLRGHKRDRQRAEVIAKRDEPKSAEGSTERGQGEIGTEVKERGAAEVTGAEAGKAHARQQDPEREAEAKRREKEEKGVEAKKKKEVGPARPLKKEPWIKFKGLKSQQALPGARSELESKLRTRLPKGVAFGGKGRKRKKPLGFKEYAKEFGLKKSGLERVLAHGTVEPEIKMKGGPRARPTGALSQPEREAGQAGWHAKIAKEAGLKSHQVRAALRASEPTGHEAAVHAAMKKIGEEGAGKKSFKKIAGKVKQAAGEIHDPERKLPEKGTKLEPKHPGFKRVEDPKSVSQAELPHVKTVGGKKVIVRPTKKLAGRRQTAGLAAEKLIHHAKHGKEMPSHEELAKHLGKSKGETSKLMTAVRTQLAPHFEKHPQLRHYMGKVKAAGRAEPMVSPPVKAEREKREKAQLEKPRKVTGRSPRSKGETLEAPSGKLLPKEKMEPLLARHRGGEAKKKEQKAGAERAQQSARAGVKLKRQQLKAFGKMVSPVERTKRWLKKGGPEEQRKAEKEAKAGRKWGLERKIKTAKQLPIGKRPSKSRPGVRLVVKPKRLPTKRQPPGTFHMLSAKPGGEEAKQIKKPTRTPLSGFLPGKVKSASGEKEKRRFGEKGARGEEPTAEDINRAVLSAIVNREATPVQAIGYLYNVDTSSLSEDDALGLTRVWVRNTLAEDGFALHTERSNLFERISNVA